MVTALMVQPESKPRITQLCCNGAYLNYAINIDSDYKCTADAFVLEKDIAILCAKDGVFHGLKPNRRIRNRIVCGTFYIVKVKNKELSSLTEKEIVKYSLRFQEREWWTDTEAIDALFREIEATS